jgi:hypothetical protein
MKVRFAKKGTGTPTGKKAMFKLKKKMDRKVFPKGIKKTLFV